MNTALESILTTGGAGFVGSRLALHLKNHFPRTRVVWLDNLYRRGSDLNLPRLQAAGIEFVRGDIRPANEFPAGPYRKIVRRICEYFSPTARANSNEPTGAPSAAWKPSSPTCSTGSGHEKQLRPLF
jgi:nucleoside-diphosphate-sugar epimerase